MTYVQDKTSRGGPAPTIGHGRGVTMAAYVALFLLGGVEALIGTFQYSRGPGALVAICFAVGILVTCVLGAYGMRTAAGGVIPAAGWFLVALLLGTSGSGGTVLVTNSTQGQWFLFGGAACAAAGAVIAFALWSRPRHASRSGPPKGGSGFPPRRAR